MDRLNALKKFYAVLGTLESNINGFRYLEREDALEGCPNDGVYFFFDSREPRSVTGDGPRVVRVGTHRKIGRLKPRLQYHLRGPRRNSCFRELVEDALVSREARGVTSNEIDEGIKAEILTLPFLWVSVPGPAVNRDYVERNAIALLSNYSERPELDRPSATWLGKHSAAKVSQSGLWNRDHVDLPYDAVGAKVFLLALRGFVAKTTAKG